MATHDLRLFFSLPGKDERERFSRPSCPAPAGAAIGGDEDKEKQDKSRQDIFEEEYGRTRKAAKRRRDLIHEIIKENAFIL